MGITIVEMHILITLGSRIGTINVIGIIILTAMIGISFARAQGLQILTRMQNTFQQGQIPGRELLEGAMVMAGGLLSIAPGIMADVFGFLLLFPPTRLLFVHIALAYLRKKYHQGHIHVVHTYPQEQAEDVQDDRQSLPPGNQE